MARQYLVNAMVFLSLASCLVAEDASVPATPRIAVCNPLAVASRQTTKVILRGWNLEKATAVTASSPRVSVAIVKSDVATVPGKQDAKQVGDQQLELNITVEAEQCSGAITLQVVTPTGESRPHELLIGSEFPVIDEVEPNEGFRAAQAIQLPQAVDGQIHADGNVDVFVFAVSEATRLHAEIRAQRLGSALDSLLTLYRDSGAIVAYNDDQSDTADSLLTAELLPGQYFLSLQDAHDRGGPAHPYRLLLKTDRLMHATGSEP